MSAYQKDWQGHGGDDPAVGLEGQLRNLVLANTTTMNESSARLIALPNLTYSGGPNFPLSLGANPSHLDYTNYGDSARLASQPVPQSPKTSRRRPNQAQRRQMNAQFTIAPDIRPQQPFHNHQPRPTPPYQRHMVTNSHPQPLSWQRDFDVPRSHGSWSGPSQGGAINASGYSPLLANSHLHQTSLSSGTRQPPGGFQNQRRPYFRPDEIANQAGILDMLCYQVVSSSEIDRAEIAQKEVFRQRIESISRQVISRYEQEQKGSEGFPISSVELKCFGSLSSGFATKASDMDLGLLSPLSKVQPDAPGSPIPRLLEKALLDAGLGARLLSRTRVPIIKLCESPPEKLRQDLLDERKRWEDGGRMALEMNATMIAHFMAMMMITQMRAQPMRILHHLPSLRSPVEKMAEYNIFDFNKGQNILSHPIMA
ncbi:hypothetical protein PT974_00502 [Cladobotryum mycophilum]|uniref:Poly(A) RNA polymerase mitochondrial-like central palm domain-containing protein n=1 Tax=Cladobotryum mycophilum TaxID=491253 RepID=A0ABR0T286_9HYPO